MEVSQITAAFFDGYRHFLLVGPSSGIFISHVAKLATCNPFGPERETSERWALGDQFVEPTSIWNVRYTESAGSRNTEAILRRLRHIYDGAEIKSLRTKRIDLHSFLEKAAYVLLFHSYAPEFDKEIERCLTHAKPDDEEEHQSDMKTTRRFTCYPDFKSHYDHYVPVALHSRRLPPAEAFALFFQLRRAFHLIYRFIKGGSKAIVELRSSVWQSIFTHDLQQYVDYELSSKMLDVPTLITGPSGTGKEAVARAIGLSQQIPFKEDTCRFVHNFVAAYSTLHLSAIPTTLVESELFGHAKGAFTGALAERAGWLETCPAHGAVFLDEIGDIDLGTQMKLLRVLQLRRFHRVGEQDPPRHFRGKLIAATNRNFTDAISRGEYREDLYYRLCADRIHTPTLLEQIDGGRSELEQLVAVVVGRIIKEDERAHALTQDVTTWIDNNLSLTYKWPGNFRELEHCVTNYIVRKNYKPLSFQNNGLTLDIDEHLAKINCTAETLLDRYCSILFAIHKTYQSVADVTGIDYRTVHKRVSRYRTLQETAYLAHRKR